jgi:hypothetical protein
MAKLRLMPKPNETRRAAPLRRIMAERRQKRRSPPATRGNRMNDVVHGYNDARFDKVRQALADAITTGEEVGAAIAIDIDGESVVEAGDHDLHSRCEDLLLGWLGRIDGADQPDRRATVAYVMNKMGPGLLGSERTEKYAALIYESLA